MTNVSWERKTVTTIFKYTWKKWGLLFACMIQERIIYTEIRIAPIGSTTITSCLIFFCRALEAKKMIYIKGMHKSWSIVILWVYKKMKSNFFAYLKHEMKSYRSIHKQVPQYLMLHHFDYLPQEQTCWDFWFDNITRIKLLSLLWKKNFFLLGKVQLTNRQSHHYDR